MKKVILAVVILAMIIAFPAVAFAASGSTYGSESEQKITTIGNETFTYEVLNDGTAKIIFYHYEDWKTIPDETNVPEEIDGYIVSTLEDLSYSKTDIDPYYRAYRTVFIPDSMTNIIGNPFAEVSVRKFSVNPSHPTLAVIDGALFNKNEKGLIATPSSSSKPVIPDGIKKIGTCSYRYDYDDNFIIPASVEEIDDYAFVQGTSVSKSWSDDKIVIKNGDVKIGNNPFLYCRNLIKIDIVSNHLFFDKETKAFYDTQDGRFICMLRTSESKNYIIPDDIKTIGEHAFSYCNVERVTIPASVTSIGQTAFEDCSKLTEIIVDEGSYAEQYCKDLGLYYSYVGDDWLNN